MFLSEYLISSVAKWLCDGFLKDGWICNKLKIENDQCPIILYIDDEFVCIFYRSIGEIRKYNLSDNSYISFSTGQDNNIYLYDVYYPFLYGFINSKGNVVVLMNVLNGDKLCKWDSKDLSNVLTGERIHPIDDFHEWNSQDNTLRVSCELKFYKKQKKLNICAKYRTLSFSDTIIEKKTSYKKNYVYFDLEAEYGYLRFENNILQLTEPIDHKRKCLHVMVAKRMSTVLNNYQIFHDEDDEEEIITIFKQVATSDTDFYRYRPCKCQV